MAQQKIPRFSAATATFLSSMHTTVQIFKTWLTLLFSISPPTGDLLQTSRTNPNYDSAKPAFADAAPTPRAKPIAIELPPPPSRKIASNSVYTPIEPLSGRGDISG